MNSLLKPIGYTTRGLVVKGTPESDNSNRIRVRIFEIHGDPLSSMANNNSKIRCTPDSRLPWIRAEVPAGQQYPDLTPDADKNKGMYKLYPPDSLVLVSYPAGNEPVVTGIILDAATVRKAREKLETGLSNSLAQQTDGSYIRNGSPDNVEALRTKVSENAYNILKSLTSKGFNTAVALGLLVNIKFESDFNPGYSSVNSNSQEIGGLVKWSGTRFDKMKSRTSNWKTNIEGQVQFIWDELTDKNVSGSKYYTFNTECYKKLLSLANDYTAAYEAFKIWLKIYIEPNDYEHELSRREQTLIEYWNYIVVSTEADTLDGKVVDAYKYFFAYPLTTEALVTSQYGNRTLNGQKDFHYGVDLGIATGTPVYAAGNGTVASIADTFTHGKMNVGGMDSYGNHVLIDHGTCPVDGKHYYTMYAHLSKVSVLLNQTVQGGQWVGERRAISYSYPLSSMSQIENAKRIWSLGRLCGTLGIDGLSNMTTAECAGMLGNMEMESGIDSTSVEGRYGEPYQIGSGKASVLSPAPNYDLPATNMDNYVPNVLEPMYKNAGITINLNAYKGSDGHYYCGMGLIQWTGPAAQTLVAYANSLKKHWYNLEIQCAELFDISKGLGARVQNYLKVTASKNCRNKPKDCAAAWLGTVEMPGVQGLCTSEAWHYSDRAAYAQKWFDTLKNSSPETETEYRRFAEGVVSLIKGIIPPYKQTATLIGYSGDTGASWGAHLHFEVDINQAMNPTDPNQFFKF